MNQEGEQQYTTDPASKLKGVMYRDERTETNGEAEGRKHGIDEEVDIRKQAWPADAAARGERQAKQAFCEKRARDESEVGDPAV